MTTKSKSRRNGMRPETDVGFRLLDSANINNYYLSVVNYEPPEPPRAPEPYKLASSTMARAHRKSSFVILAETEEGSAKSSSDSPTHGGRSRSARSTRSRSPVSPTRPIRTGRASPFRPRGFKGPPPHAQSRAPSPPPILQRRRFVQTKSLSQGNSPRKQSLIPQPRGGLTTIKSKNQKPERERWERRGSRKFTNLPRTSSLKTPQPVRRPLIEASRQAKGKPPKTMTKLPRQALKSPTKIPIRNSTNSINTRFVKISNDNTTKIKKPESFPRQQQTLNQPSAPIVPLSMKNISNPPDSSPLVTDDSVIMGGLSGYSDSSIRRTREEEELGLVDLLKQSSGASGTSSVVNLTTTTAVQPLRIDAATILPQASPADAPPEKKEFNSLISPNPAPKKMSPSVDKRETERSQIVTAVASVEPVKDEKLPSISQTPQPSKPPAKPTTSKDNIKPDKNESSNPVDMESVQNPLSSNPHDTSSVVVDESQRASKAGSKAQSKAGSKPQSNRTSPRSVRGNDGPKDIEKGEREREGSATAKNQLRNHGSETSLKSSKSNGLSTGSVESIRSTDTGVSLNTVRGVHGVSSAREKRGTHMVKRADEIETLSGNVMHLERATRPENGEPAIVETSGRVVGEQQNLTRLGRFRKWRNSLGQRWRQRWRSSGMTCLGGRAKDNQRAQATNLRANLRSNQPTRCARFRAALSRGFRWGTRVAPSEPTTCCRPERTCGFLCNRNWCRLPNCSCLSCNCCRRSSEDERSKNIRAKHSLTSVAPPPLSEAQKPKLPDVLVEHNSVMRGAIPCLPVPLAWFCLVWNVLLPGTGTVWSGLFNLCVGQPRFAQTASGKSRLGALIVNIIVGASQAFTVLFCLVGWGWSIWWAVTMIRLARKWKRFKAAEATNGDPEARGPEGVLPAPGVPTQALRGVERAR
ncbi:serine/arginine repetitive matrix protein 2 [Fopius arisanus]|uniref:Serine/arginine repetitive matrix protein 2 n=3 Tax=Fopius arisanus TaxID=64838 RepID=A0A9R1TD63_9HYME|nr:PREDICTED: serine/arginine repetitive matrix protein 2 [Fopius arisanus]